jgi:hypothetical protein
MERQVTTIADGCVDSGLTDRFKFCFMIACLLLLLNGVAIAIVTRLRRWRPVPDANQKQLVITSTFVEPDLMTEVRTPDL